MNRLFCFTVAVAAALAASAADFTWSGGTTTGGPANAKEFADGDNWTGGAYPNDKDAVADVKAAGSSAYLKLDANPVTLTKLAGSSAMLLGSKTLTFEKSSANANPNCNVANFYTPVKVASGQLFLYGNRICNTFDVADAASIMANNTSLNFRDDFWANAAGGERVFSKIPGAYAYHGGYAFYSPRAKADSWYLTLTKDSPFATSKSGWAIYDRCSAGQLVSGPGIKDGTYVKRIFDSMTLELSEPATDSVVDAAVTFAAQTVKITRAFGKLGHNSSTDHSTTIYVNRHAEDEDYAVEVDALQLYPLSGTFRRTTLSTTSGYVPGKLIVHNTKYPGAGAMSRIALENCYVEFGETSYDSTSKTTPEPGFPWSEVEFAKAAHTARLGVRAGLSAVVPCFLSFKGTVEKVGPGALTVGFAAGAETTGSVVVEEGSFGFADDAEAGTIVLGSLTVKAGATFVVPVQGVRIQSVAVESGATIAGSGKLYLPSLQDMTGATIAPTVTIVPDAIGAKVVLDLPAPATAATLPGDPAFWVDCSKTNTMTLVKLSAAKVGSTDGVYRINDVRKTSDDDPYLFSTNCSGHAATAYLPVLQYDKRKKLHHVYFAGNCASPLGSIFNTDAHAWSRPVADIRVVFEVYGGDGSGTTVDASTPFLGATSGGRLDTALPVNAVRAPGESWSRYSNVACFFSWASAAMKAGEFNVNGEAKDVAVDKPPYGSPLGKDAYDQTHTYYCHPMVTDLTIPDTTNGSGKRVSHIADAYTFCPASYNTQGCTATEKKRLFELIVYTNALTQAEIVSVRRYLMRKWLTQDAPVTVRDMNPGRVGSVNGGLEIAAGESYYAENVADDATFVKKGAGTVYVENAYAPATSVAVAGGTLKVRSFDPTKLALTEDDQVTVHWDASKIDDDHFTYAEDPERGVKTVTKWKDVKATSGTKQDASIWKSASTNKPFIAENKLNGLSVLDFGPFYEFGVKDDFEKTASAMTTTSIADNHAVIAVWGSENGGGTLLGEVGTYWSNGIGLARDAPTYGGAASDPICRNELHQSFANPYSYLCRKNGVSVDPRKTGLSGTFDLVSHVSWSAFTLYALQAMDNDNKQWLGGGQFGEMIVCKMGLSPAHLTEVEAYLQKKWFDKDTDGYREASLGTVSVGTGATLEVTGGGRLHVGTLAAAGGTVKGNVVLAADAALQAVVNADGSISPVAIDGTIAAAGGTVTFVGTAEAFAALQPGQYELVSGLGSAAVGDWTVDVSTLPRKFRKDATVFVRDGKLYVQIFKSGLAVIVR